MWDKSNNIYNLGYCVTLSMSSLNNENIIEQTICYYKYHQQLSQYTVKNNILHKPHVNIQSECQIYIKVFTLHNKTSLTPTRLSRHHKYAQEVDSPF